MIAALGYDAFALDLYGKGNRPTDTDARKREATKLYQDRTRMRKLLLVGLNEALAYCQARSSRARCYQARTNSRMSRSRLYRTVFPGVRVLTWDRKARRDASVSFAPPHNLVRPAPRKSSSKIGHHLFHGLHAG
jgi:hypothetical protein